MDKGHAENGPEILLQSLSLKNLLSGFSEQIQKQRIFIKPSNWHTVVHRNQNMKIFRVQISFFIILGIEQFRSIHIDFVKGYNTFTQYNQV